MRDEPADEKSAARRRDVDRCLGQIGAARIGVDERQGGPRFLDPASVQARQVRTRVRGRREDAENFSLLPVEQFASKPRGTYGQLVSSSSANVRNLSS